MFGFAPPLQHRLLPGAQTALSAMQRLQQGGAPVDPLATPAAGQGLPSLAPAKPGAGPATMAPDTSLPPLVAPTVPQGTGLEDASAALPGIGGAAPTGGLGELAAGGGEGIDIASLISALFG